MRAIKRQLFENDLAEAVLGETGDSLPLPVRSGKPFPRIRDQEEVVVFPRYQAVPLVRYRTGRRAGCSSWIR